MERPAQSIFPRMPRKKKEAPAQPQERQVSTRAQIERLYGIVAKIQNREAQNLGALAAVFEVETRTIQRDITFLRDRLGVPVEFDRSLNRYAIAEDFSHTPPLELDSQDFLLLSFLQQCLAPYAATEIGAAMNASFQRLFGVLTGTHKWRQWSEPILFRSEDVPRGQPRELEVFRVLHEAVTAHRAVEFDYKPRQKPAGRRTVHPLLILLHRGRWYLYGAAPGAASILVFSFNRIQNVSLQTEQFDPSSYPDPRAQLRWSFGVMISPAQPVDVVLEFEPVVADRVRETIWHPEQRLEEIEGDRLRLTLPLNQTREIEPWIRTWGPYIRVCAPPPLVERMAR